MKTTIVPAQVTTIEDKVAGNLSFTQLLLLTTPVFLDGALFVFFPPLMKITIVKIVLCGLITLFCMTMAIRLKGKLVMEWLTVIFRYNLRPGYFIFNKNDLYLREELPKLQPLEQGVVAQPARTVIADAPRRIPITEMVRLQSAVADPRSKFHLRSTKGGLRVFIREIKEESI